MTCPDCERLRGALRDTRWWGHSTRPQEWCWCADENCGGAEAGCKEARAALSAPVSSVPTGTCPHHRTETIHGSPWRCIDCGAIYTGKGSWALPPVSSVESERERALEKLADAAWVWANTEYDQQFSSGAESRLVAAIHGVRALKSKRGEG